MMNATFTLANDDLRETFESMLKEARDIKNKMIDDAKEGIDAFIGKRSPTWKHC